MNRLVHLWLTAAVIVLVLSTACGGGGGLSTWYVDPLVKLFPDSPPGTDASSGARWLVARNGHASIQLAVRSAAEVAELQVAVEAPAAGGTSLEATVRWVDYVPVGSNTPGAPDEELIRQAPALFPDPLREDFPIALKPDHTQPIWITVYCPAGVEPGDYGGRVTLTSGADQLEAKEFTVRVAAATVPAEQTLKVTNWFTLGAAGLARQYKGLDQDSPEYWQLLENLGRVMADHGQNVILTPVSSLAQPSLSGGSLRYDFSGLDKWVETFERAGLIGTIEGGHLLGRSAGYSSPITINAWVVERGEPVRLSLTPDDPRAERYLRSFLTTLYTHLKARGWEQHYVQHILDEPHDLEAPIYNRYAKIVRECLPGVPTVDAVSLHQDIGFFADVLDVWVPVLGSFDHDLDRIKTHVDQGGQSWFYTCVFPQSRYLNRFIDYPLLKVRLLHWFNFRYNFTGYLHWGGNYWGPRPFENVQTVINNNLTLLPPGDNALIYPNPAENSVLSSIRLEAMREGIEDYELLTVLAQKDPEAARALAEALIPNINDYVRDPAQFRSYRQQLLEALQ
jgi:glycosyl hydrolase family 123